MKPDPVPPAIWQRAEQLADLIEAAGQSYAGRRTAVAFIAAALLDFYRQGFDDGYAERKGDGSSATEVLRRARPSAHSRKL